MRLKYVWSLFPIGTSFTEANEKIGRVSNIRSEQFNDMIEQTETDATFRLRYMNYNTGGCIGRNELGITTTPVVEECASACDALPECISFEYKKSSTTCQLSSSCDDFSLTVNDPNDPFMWYLKVTDEVHTFVNPTPYAYLSLQDNRFIWELGTATGNNPTNIYIGYDTGGCIGRNELGVTTTPVVEECASACDALPDCVSFEYKKSSTTCQLSSSCNAFDLTVNDPNDPYMWYLKVGFQFVTLITDAFCDKFGYPLSAFGLTDCSDDQ